MRTTFLPIGRSIAPLVLGLAVVGALELSATRVYAQAPRAAKPALNSESAIALFDEYCATCHNATAKTAGILLDKATLTSIASHGEELEKAVRQLRAQSMPPPGMPRPDSATYMNLAAFLETELDRAAAASPNAGVLPPLHRLTRTEYANAVRDLFAIENLPKEMDFTFLLPADNASSGFDNIADLLYISPATMERYLDSAKKISRLAVGDMSAPPMVNIHRLPLEGYQGTQVDLLPMGTRGGFVTNSYFPLDGEYTFQIGVAGALGEEHQMDLLIDGERAGNASVGGRRRGGGGGAFGRALPTEFRVKVSAGPHLIGVTFAMKTRALDETILRTRMRTRGSQPAVSEVTIRGPYNATGPGDTPSRQKIFVCQPKAAAEEAACANQILTTLARRAYRRPVTKADVDQIMPFYQAGYKEAGFERGIQTAMERILVSPQFLYRIERDPASAGEKPHPLTDLELASRLSFFIWASIPDDELLRVAAAGQLKQPAVLTRQVRRMLADDRSTALVNTFASQWLYLRDVEQKQPDLFVFRDFDETLREAFEKETELFVESVLRENRPLTELLTADYTFLNERLAKHYGVPNVRGPQFRRVTLPADSPRRGLLGQGSILTLTSYATRTSPVLRGKYVLENLLASPPPPPPPNVPALKTESDNTGKTLTLRQAMEQHRANPACASCHARMDPIGFAMENFNAIGEWRDHALGQPLDVASDLADGTRVDGINGVRQLILSRPERFAGAVAEKLLMYALGRNVQYYDAPAVRKIVRQASPSKYTFESLVLGVVSSAPFQTRAAVAPKEATAR